MKQMNDEERLIIRRAVIAREDALRERLNVINADIAKNAVSISGAEMAKQQIQHELDVLSELYVRFLETEEH